MTEKMRKLYFLFVLIVAVSSNHSLIGSTENCWINDEMCLVHATLHKSLTDVQEPMRNALPLEIDCAMAKSTVNKTQPPDYLIRRIERASTVTLNGCHKDLKWSTFGFEFLPNCAKIIELTVEQFHADALYKLQCPGATFMQLEVLRFQHNDIAAVTNASLSNLALLREIYFDTNALRHIEENAFDNLHFIETIHIENEPLLAIKDMLLFDRINVADLRLIGLKQVTSFLFENLPQTLLQLYIKKTRISDDARDELAAIGEHDVSGLVYVNNPRIVRNISLIDCELRIFRLNDMHGSVMFLNLSSNRLEQFEVTNDGDTANIKSELQVLDLSYNQLKTFPLSWLQTHKLNHLEKLYLQGNHLKQLPLLSLLVSLPVVKFIDLTANKLERFLETSDKLESAMLYQVRLRIDDNPWNCKWLLDFAHAHPDKYRIFQYEKFLSQINVNGLACIPVEATNETAKLKSSTNSTTNFNDTYLNISTFTLIYGSPWDVKRNQRAEALIIVFMLPVGIAVLFLLLYLWIYCQKVFHISFYQKCPLLKRRREHAQPRLNAVTNRFDVVRQLPPNTTVTGTTLNMNNNEGYELPLNGIPSICNCVNNDGNSSNNTSNAINDKCRKTHHITYVPLPEEQTPQIYEEIICNEEDKSDGVGDDDHKVNPIYDHLKFL